MKRPNSTGVWEGRQSLSKLELDLSRYCDLCSDEVGHENLACESECNVGKEVGARPQREPANINKDFHFLPHIAFSSLPMSYHNKSTDSWPTSLRRSRSVGMIRAVR